MFYNVCFVFVLFCFFLVGKGFRRTLDVEVQTKQQQKQDKKSQQTKNNRKHTRKNKNKQQSQQEVLSTFCSVSFFYMRFCYISVGWQGFLKNRRCGSTNKTTTTETKKTTNGKQQKPQAKKRSI